MSETLEKLFYRCFLIVSLFVFVFFPTEYYVQTYADNETFWIPVFQVILQISGLLFLSWFVQNWSPKRRLAAVCLIPVLLFAVSVWLHVSTVLQYGLNTTQVSDFENAFVTSSVEPPIHSTWYQAFSSWAIFPLTLRIMQGILGEGLTTVLLINAVLYALNTVLIYYAVYFSSTEKRILVGTMAGGLYALLPSGRFWSIICAPDYYHIFFLLLGLLCVILAVKVFHTPKSRILVVAAAAILVALSSFYKATAKIMIVAMIIVWFFRCWSQHKILVENGRGFWRAWSTALKPSVLYGILFLTVFLAAQNAVFKVLDAYVGDTVARKPSTHAIFTGLHSECRGYWTSEYGYLYFETALENDCDFERTKEILMEELKWDILENKHLNPSFFFSKAIRTFRGEDYFEFVEMTLDPNGAAVKEDILNQQAALRQCYYMILALCVTWSVYEMRNKQDTLFFVCAVFLTGFILLMLLLENQPRYKIVVFPCLCIMAAYSFSFIPKKWDR